MAFGRLDQISSATVCLWGGAKTVGGWPGLPQARTRVFSSLTTLEGGPSPRLRSGQALGVKLAFAFSASPQGWDSRMPRVPFLTPEPVNSKIGTNPRV